MRFSFPFLSFPFLGSWLAVLWAAMVFLQRMDIYVATNPSDVVGHLAGCQVVIPGFQLQIFLETLDRVLVPHQLAEKIENVARSPLPDRVRGGVPLSARQSNSMRSATG